MLFFEIFSDLYYAGFNWVLRSIGAHLDIKIDGSHWPSVELMIIDHRTEKHFRIS